MVRRRRAQASRPALLRARRVARGGRPGPSQDVRLLSLLRGPQRSPGRSVCRDRSISFLSFPHFSPCSRREAFLFSAPMADFRLCTRGGNREPFHAGALDERSGLVDIVPDGLVSAWYEDPATTVFQRVLGGEVKVMEVPAELYYDTEKRWCVGRSPPNSCSRVHLTLTGYHAGRGSKSSSRSTRRTAATTPRGPFRRRWPRSSTQPCSRPCRCAELTPGLTPAATGPR